MDAIIFVIIIFGVWIVSRLGGIRDELVRIRFLLEDVEEGET